MANLNPIQKNRPIINDKGVLTEENRVYFDLLEQLVPKNGLGSPEGVVEGLQGATYYDLSNGVTNRIYIKLVNNIGGDATLGWEQQTV